MLVIGLTGGIGSGKSTVAKLFAEKGIPIIDTDQLAREVTLPGQPALKAIIDKFGDTILLPDKTLDRAQLRKQVFKDPLKRSWLEALLHPLIRAEAKRQIQLTKSKYCIVVIPLLVETMPNPLIDRILVVDTTLEHQLHRAKARDSLSEQEIKNIIESQVSREQRLKAADDIILNDGTLDHLQQQVDQLHLQYLK